MTRNPLQQFKFLKIVMGLNGNDEDLGSDGNLGGF